MNMDKEQFDKAFSSMWETLTEEQRRLILQRQADEVKKAAAKAKKESTQRMLDRYDRERIEAVLRDADCGNVSLSLNAARVLALRWILSDNDLQSRFGLHVKRQLGK